MTAVPIHLPSPTPPDHLRVVAGAWLRDGAVLAALRPADKALGGFWELPGGKVEPGESDAMALRRELYEELGVQLEIGACFAEDVKSRSRDGGLHLVAMLVHDGDERHEPVALEHDALSWVPLDDLGRLRWADGDQRLLEALVRTLDPSC